MCTHEEQLVLVLALIGRHKVHFDVHLLLFHGNALDARKLVLGGVAQDQPPAFGLHIGVQRGGHLRHARFVILFLLKVGCTFRNGLFGRLQSSSVVVTVLGTTGRQIQRHR